MVTVGDDFDVATERESEDASWREPGITDAEKVVRYLEKNPDAGNKRVSAETGVPADRVAQYRRGKPIKATRPRSTLSKSSNASPDKWPEEAKGVAGTVAVNEIASRAQQQTEWDLNIGEMVREWYVEHGIQFDSSNVQQFLGDVLTFWWQNRDRIAAVEQELAARDEEIRQLRAVADPILFRRNAYNTISRAVLLAAMNGNPIPEGNILSLMKAAEMVHGRGNNGGEDL